MSDHQHLRKNEFEYYLCPLCGHALIYDSNPEELYCPQMVDVHKEGAGGIRWNHFDIQVVKPGVRYEGQHRWIAVIPPFYVSWYQESQTLYLSQFGTQKEDWRMHTILQYQSPYPEEDLIKLYKRLENLKAFT